jgi:hypothetical protein
MMRNLSIEKLKNNYLKKLPKSNLPIVSPAQPLSSEKEVNSSAKNMITTILNRRSIQI